MARHVARLVYDPLTERSSGLYGFHDQQRGLKLSKYF
jgi:hypothetical protein